MEQKKISISTRLLFYFGTFLYTVSLFVFVRNADAYYSPELSRILGVASSLTALIAGIVALIKFDTRKKVKYIFVGFGLFGASILDFYYMVLANYAGGAAPFKFNISASYLSIMFFASWAIWYWKKITNGKDDKPSLTFMTGTLSISVALALFLTKIHFTKDLLVFIASLFFLATLLGYFLKRTWTFKYFEHIFVGGLIAFFLSQALFLSTAKTPYDTMYLVSDVVRLLAYAITLAGLLMSTHNAFMLVERFGRTTEARLSASIDNLPIGYALTDSDDNIIKTNKRLLTLLAIEGRDSNKVLDKVLNVKKRCRECREKATAIIEDEINFGERYLKLFVTPVFVGNDVVGTVILAQDVTEARLLEHTKDEFIALASHELRTPVTTIKGNAELIGQLFPEVLKNKGLKEIVNDIHESSKRLIQIIEEFLDVSSLEQKKMEFKKEKFNLVEAVNDVVKGLTGAAKDKGLYLKVDAEGKERLMVAADSARLKQVLYNLIGNSIKFTEGGGIHVFISRKDGMAEVSVQDTGTGIGESERKMLFKKFQQVGEDFLKHDSTQGVGLGLYISDMLVKNMGGEIYLLESEVGKGSTFAFTLPLSH